MGLVEEDKRTDGRPTHVEAEGLKSRAVAIATEGKAAKRGVCFFHRTMKRKTCRGRVGGGEGAGGFGQKKADRDGSLWIDGGWGVGVLGKVMATDRVYCTE